MKDVVLGLLWLRSMNPAINWAEGMIKLGSKMSEWKGNPVE